MDGWKRCKFGLRDCLGQSKKIKSFFGVKNVLKIAIKKLQTPPPFNSIIMDNFVIYEL